MEYSIRILISQFLRKYFLFVKGKKYSLAILDDLLPLSGSPWRNAEYEGLLKEFDNSKVVADLKSYYNFKNHLSYDENLIQLSKLYPILSTRIEKAKIGTSINAKLVYTLFYGNIARYYQLLIKKKISYGFTLYPGGGFIVDNQQIDENLIKIIKNDFCKFVIVNQSYTYNYLIDKLKINKEKVHLVIGGPITYKQPKTQIGEKFIKDATHIVFMSSKYMIYGLDKGFDVFQNVILELLDYKNLYFHVVGNFIKDDIIYPEIEKKVTFHGYINEHDFESFFLDKDVIISPNRPNTLANGAFDGFPLASSATAGMFGCLMMLTNELNENPELLVDKIHYIKIKPNHKDISSKILNIISDKDLAKKIATCGKEKIIELIDEKNLDKKIDVFKQYI